MPVRFAVVVLALLALPAPVASSDGAAVVAVLDDGTREVTFTHDGNVALAVPEIDVTRATFSHMGDDLVVVLDVVDLGGRVVEDGRNPHSFYVVSGPTADWRVVGIVAQYVDMTQRAWFTLFLWPHGECPTCAPGRATIVDLAGTWDEDSSTVTVHVPRAYFTDALRDVRVTAVTGYAGLRPSPFTFADVAPDYGRGIDVPT